MINMAIKNKKAVLELSQEQKTIVSGLVDKYYLSIKDLKSIRLIKKTELEQLLTSEEIEIIDFLYEIKPTELGFKGEYVGNEDPPDNMVEITPMVFRVKDKDIPTEIQYLPEPIYKKLDAMIKKMATDGAGRLLIYSGYRSPAFQALLFLKFLKRNNYELKKTGTSVALPGYSQHGSSTSPAVDFITPDGIPSDKNPFGFETTKQYAWLQIHAKTYNFYLSYPLDNSYGVIFEPWHWRYIPKQK